MLYNLKHIQQVNFNLFEATSLANSSTDVVFLTYLGIHFKRKLPRFHKLVNELNLSDYPSLDSKEYIKDRKSEFYFNCPRHRLYYIDVLSLPIDDYLKVLYLQLVSKIPPYSQDKLIPQKLVGKVPNELVLRGLIKPAGNSFILPKEREGEREWD